MTFAVPDIRHAASYSATLISAANQGNALRGETAGYTLRIHPLQ